MCIKEQRARIINNIKGRNEIPAFSDIKTYHIMIVIKKLKY